MYCMTLIPWKAFVFRRRLMVIQVTMHEHTDSWNFKVAFYIDSNGISRILSLKSITVCSFRKHIYLRLLGWSYQMQLHSGFDPIFCRLNSQTLLVWCALDAFAIFRQPCGMCRVCAECEEWYYQGRKLQPALIGETEGGGGKRIVNTRLFRSGKSDKIS